MAFKLTFMATVPFFENYIDFTIDTTKNTRRKKYKQPAIAVNSKWGMATFKYKAADLWINLPLEVHNKVTKLSTFKQALTEYVYECQLSKHCKSVENEELQLYLEVIETVVSLHVNMWCVFFFETIYQTN